MARPGLTFLIALLFAAPAEASWWESKWVRGGAMAGAVVAASTLDHEAREFFARNRSQSSDLVASQVRPLGRPRIYVPVSLGMLGAGVLTGDRNVLAAGTRVTSTVILAGLFTRGLKYGVGRARPSKGKGNGAFDAFSNQTSFPSGHATMTFALAEALSYEASHRGVTALCYGLATLTAWSRLNDDVHWLSDTVGGSILGVLSGKAVQRVTRALGLRTSLAPLPGSSDWALTLGTSF